MFDLRGAGIVAQGELTGYDAPRESSGPAHLQDLRTLPASRAVHTDAATQVRTHSRATGDKRKADVCPCAGNHIGHIR